MNGYGLYRSLQFRKLNKQPTDIVQLKFCQVFRDDPRRPARIIILSGVELIGARKRQRVTNSRNVS